MFPNFLPIHSPRIEEIDFCLLKLNYSLQNNFSAESAEVMCVKKYCMLRLQHMMRVFIPQELLLVKPYNSCVSALKHFPFVFFCFLS